MASTATPDIETDPDTEVEPVTRTLTLPPHAVILHDDDFNGFDFVVAALRKVFGYTLPKCVELMLEAHRTGRSIVWVGPKEVAELKAEQIVSCGGDPGNPRALPLKVTVEPVT
jgi:ATP-dependent Clp protease adaptor protein ClpS